MAVVQRHGIVFQDTRGNVWTPRPAFLLRVDHRHFYKLGRDPPLAKFLWRRASKTWGTNSYMKLLKQFRRQEFRKQILARCDANADDAAADFAVDHAEGDLERSSHLVDEIFTLSTQGSLSSPRQIAVGPPPHPYDPQWAAEYRGWGRWFDPQGHADNS